MIPKDVIVNEDIVTKFSKKDIVTVTTRAYRGVNGWTYSGRIYFKKYQSKLSHNIHGNSMEDLLSKMKKFMKNLS